MPHDWINVAFDVAIAATSGAAALLWFRGSKVPYNAGAPDMIPHPRTPKAAWAIAGQLNSKAALLACIAAGLMSAKTLVQIITDVGRQI